MLTIRRSDRAIVLRTMEGHPEAFEALVFRYQRKAHAVARALGLRTPALDDVVQEAFLQAFRDLPSLREPASFGSWFLHIVRHVSIKELRRAGRAGGPEATGAGPPGRASPGQVAPSVAEEVERKDFREHLWRKVAELPEGTREAIFLYHYEGESVRAVARALGISVSGAKKRLRAGREELREKLWRELEETLRETLPSARDWKRSARRLSLLVLGSIPATWTARAGGMVPTGGADPIGALSRAAAAARRMKAQALLGTSKKAGLAAMGLLVLFFGAAAWKGWTPRATERVAAPEATPARVEPGRKPKTETPGIAAAPRDEELAPPPEEEAVEETHSGDDDRGSVVVRVIWGEDHTPAAGVSGFVIPWGSPDLYIDERTFTTGPDGTARVDRIFRGGGRVQLDRGGSADVHVAPGEEREVLIVMPPGFHVEGEVVDRRGYPVPDARIWISYTGHTNWRNEVARARGDGSFFVRSISSAKYIAARARDHAASDLQELKAEPGDTIRVRLVLNGEGGEAVLTVVDEGGDPVPNAKVMVGAEYSTYTLLDDGRTGLSAPPCLGFTDEEGLFRADSLPSGRTRVAVRAPGFVPLEEDMDVDPRSPLIADLVLRRGATLSGRVTGSDGEPIRGAQVVIGDFRDFLSIKVFAGDGGSYRLRGLPVGDLEAYSQRPGRGKASTRISVTDAGQHIAWDPVLAQDLEIRGRLVDEIGAPLEGFVLLLEESRGGEGQRRATRRTLVTDANGAFAQGELSDLSYRITLHEARDSLPCGALEDVRPSPGEVEVRIERGALSSAYIRGRVFDSEGKPHPGAKVICYSLLGGYRVCFGDRDGAYRVGPVPGGRYRIEVQAPGRPLLACGEHEIGPGEERDLGDHHLEPAFR